MAEVGFGVGTREYVLVGNIRQWSAHRGCLGQGNVWAEENGWSTIVVENYH